MTHITISDRIIAMEVLEGVKKVSIVTDVKISSLYYLVSEYETFELFEPLPYRDKTYKFLCLASEVITYHGSYLGVKNDFSEKYLIHPLLFMKLDKDKEYVLIEVE